MAPPTLEEIARALVVEGKGILAADESIGTMTQRLTAQGIESTPESRRAYRDLLFTAPGISEFISGVILFDETIRQESSKEGIPFGTLLLGRGIIPGIKVDKGAKPLAGAPGERVTEGLDGLRERLAEYHSMGARFAKWRAVIRIEERLPTSRCVQANAAALARYAALCQEQQLVPIVEPEVLMDGPHALERCEAVTGGVLHAVFDALFDAEVVLERMLLKPNMVISGLDCPSQAKVEEVARATVRTLARQVPPAVPGVAFLSGGQNHVLATEHLNAINQLGSQMPWRLSFSFGRALQDEAIAAWAGRRENVPMAQALFYRRARCDSAATRGWYRREMESEPGFIPSTAPTEIHQH